MDTVELGKRIRLLRTKSGLTIKDLADIVELSPSTVSCIENGKSTPLTVSFVKIANFFNVNAAYLLCNSVEADKYILLSEINNFLNALNTSQKQLVTSMMKSLINEYISKKE